MKLIAGAILVLAGMLPISAGLSLGFGSGPVAFHNGIVIGALPIAAGIGLLWWGIISDRES